MNAKIRIIRPSSREQADLLPPRVEALRRRGFEVRYDDLPGDPRWLYTAGTAKDRAAALEAALTEEGTAVVLCARGGYGASDLLPLLDWDRLRRAPPKVVAGFSDVSALHAALWTRLGWPGLHAPMPATTLWEKDGVTDDVDQLLELVTRLAHGLPLEGRIPLEPVIPGEGAPRAGKLFGGCFTVLTNLIGTPSFPRSLAGTVVFFEDTDEHPARLARALNQWLQSGALQGVQALVIGHLRALGDKIPDCAPFVYEELARRAGVPTYRTTAFGHTSPNLPLLVGADARIDGGALVWRHSSIGTTA